MCGIAGILNFDGKPVDQAAIDRFTDSLAHRGPDGRGTWKDDRCGIALGHRRLAILDLSESGRQPMPYLEGRYWITYNGEIFNFLEIRAELEAHGYHFHSTSDTEVILAAYDKWGPDMLSRFNGMWAFAIWDRRERSLFLARDRFGIKPLLFLLSPEHLAFASELKAFKYLTGYTPAVDETSAGVVLSDIMALEGTRRTLLRGVHRLQAGHYAVLRDGVLAIRRWWNTIEHLAPPPATIEAQAERFRELFYDSVRLRMRSDVPVGTCLSGGFDSSAVVCALAEIGRNSPDARRPPDWQKTFVASFPNCCNDERPAAEEVIRFTGVKGHFLTVEPQDALRDLDQILYAFDDVYLSPPTAVWLIYRELRRSRVVVSLDGHGADELMGGYRQWDYLLFHDAPSLWRAPQANVRLLREYWRLLQRSQPSSTAWDLLKTAGSGFFRSHRDLASTYAKLKRLPHPRGTRIVQNPSAPAGDELVPQCVTDELPADWGPENREFYRMFHSTVLPTILRNFDRLSMAHGVEIRMPFLDWRLVCFLFALPDSSKLHQGLTKFVARLAMQRRMPESIRTSKTKVGFNSPLPEWLNGPLQPWVLDAVHSAKFQQHPLFDGRRASRMIEKRCAHKSWNWQNCQTAWQCLHYYWFEQNFLRSVPPPAGAAPRAPDPARPAEPACV